MSLAVVITAVRPYDDWGITVGTYCECSVYAIGTRNITSTCGRPACWRYVLKCCQHQHLACEQHYIEHLNNYFPALSCPACWYTVGQFSHLVKAVHAV